jgi:hypothetical protein
VNYILIAIGLFLTFARPLSALTHSPLKTITGSECGISGYVQTQRKACGVEKYRSDRGEVCGAEKYNSRADLSCPGSDAGGREIRTTGSAYNGNAGLNVSINWNTAVGSTIQGNENIQAIIGYNYANANTFGEWDSKTGAWIRETNYWKCRLQAASNPQFSYAAVSCIAKPYAATCEKKEFGPALWAFCENKAFGDLSYFSCDDPNQPIYGTCQIRKTNAELEAYTSTVANDIDYNATLFATNLATFLARIQDKIQMACLIDTYYLNPQYSALIGDLVDKYESNFGELYEQNQYADQCLSDIAPVPQEVTFNELKCSALTTDDIRAGLKNTADPATKRFYNNCFSQKSYELPKSWFTFHLEEIDLLLDDVIAKNNASAKQSLLDLKTSLKSADVVK